MDALRELPVASWKDLSDVLDKLSAKAPNEVLYLFRGQSDKQWALNSTLTRAIGGLHPTKAVLCESYALEYFRSNVRRYAREEEVPPHLPLQPIMEWWALMQHYGAPTRMIDFTKSPYIGLYFAVDSNWDRDGALYIPYSCISLRIG
jgi:hypothetical protein